MDIRLQFVKKGLEYLGVKSLPGNENSPEVVEMYKKSGRFDIKNDEIPWCSAFIKAICTDLKIENTATLAARSWLTQGVKIEKPQMGDLVVFWRESPTSWKGHVGIYISQNGDQIYCLGGNQSNSVNISLFPRSQVLGFRSFVSSC